MPSASSTFPTMLSETETSRRASGERPNVESTSWLIPRLSRYRASASSRMPSASSKFPTSLRKADLRRSSCESLDEVHASSTRE